MIQPLSLTFGNVATTRPLPSDKEVEVKQALREKAPNLEITTGGASSIIKSNDVDGLSDGDVEEVLRDLNIDFWV